MRGNRMYRHGKERAKRKSRGQWTMMLLRRGKRKEMEV
jgi:hypothetical protein